MSYYTNKNNKNQYKKIQSNIYYHDCNINIVGLCNPSKINFSSENSNNFRKDHNWNEILIQETVKIPPNRPDINILDEVMVDVNINCIKIIETSKNLKTETLDGNLIYSLDKNNFPIPIADEKGFYLTGRKLLVDGVINQKVYYSANTLSQSVHSVNFRTPFSTYVILYPKFIDYKKGEIIKVDNALVDIYEEFIVDVYVEYINIYKVDNKNIYKNILLFLNARPISPS